MKHHDPREITGPIGMYHCPECGEMVVAGLEHPDYSLAPDLDQQSFQFMNPEVAPSESCAEYSDTEDSESHE